MGQPIFKTQKAKFLWDKTVPYFLSVVVTSTNKHLFFFFFLNIRSIDKNSRFIIIFNLILRIFISQRIIIFV